MGKPLIGSPVIADRSEIIDVVARRVRQCLPKAQRLREAPWERRRSSHDCGGAGGAAGARAGFSSPALDIVSLAAKPRC
jgi:hypothetical protein